MGSRAEYLGHQMTGAAPTSTSASIDIDTEEIDRVVGLSQLGFRSLSPGPGSRRTHDQDATNPTAKLVSTAATSHRLPFQMAQYWVGHLSNWRLGEGQGGANHEEKPSAKTGIDNMRVEITLGR